MLRKIFIYLSKADWARRFVMNLGLTRRMALRFVAGETLSEAIVVVKELNEKGMHATLDQLGEDTNTEMDASITTNEIIEMLDAIDAAKVRANISIKLTQIGLTIAEDVCAKNLNNILEHAKTLDNFVRIDMEDYGSVDATLRLYDVMRMEYGYENVGVVIQSYLYRSDADIALLMEQSARIRMVKGAYMESAEVAYPQKVDVDKSFDALVRHMLDASKNINSSVPSNDGKYPPLTAVATHDEVRVEKAKAYAKEHGIPKDKLEFQMLYGIRKALQSQLLDEGYPVRIYVPFGIQWYPYFMRRLAERPANLWFFLSSLVRK